MIEPQFDGVRLFSEGLAHVWIGDKEGYIDKTGKMVIESQGDWAWEFSEGLACVAIDGKWGYIDKTGKMMIEPQSLRRSGTRCTIAKRSVHVF